MGVRIKERKQKTDFPLSLCVIPVIFFFCEITQSDEKILSLPILFRRPQHSSLSENRCFFFLDFFPPVPTIYERYFVFVVWNLIEEKKRRHQFFSLCLLASFCAIVNQT